MWCGLQLNENSELFETTKEEINKMGKSIEELQVNDKEKNKPIIANLQLEKTTLQILNEELKKALDKTQKQFDHFEQLLALKKEQLRKGLFTADSSIGGKCVICQEDIEKGRKVRRLDCDGRHIFCQVCIEGWLRNNNTCPICMHKFE